MNSKERMSYLSEIAFLKKMIDSLPESSVIERLSLQNRMDDLKDILSKDEFHEPTSIQLIFRGNPVSMNHGLDADFAAVVLDKFVGMITTIVGLTHLIVETKNMRAY